MANEHIGRLKKIGLGKESTSGTPVTATAWVPATEIAFSPEIEKARDESAYGTIDQLRESITTKEMTTTEMKGIFRDGFGGNLLMALLGQDTLVIDAAIGSLSGSFVVGETVTQATSGATGVVKKILTSTRLLIQVTSGAFTSGSNTITGGTSSATGIPTYTAALKGHLFQRLNTNTHPSYTLVSVDPVETMRSPYSMLDTFELEANANGFLMFSAKWMGKKMASTSASPAYTDENEFMGSGANMKLGNTLTLAFGASATPITSFKITGAKNLEAYQAFGSTDIASVHNKQFKITGEITALFNATTLRDLVTASTKQGVWVEFVATNSPASRIMIMLPQVSFEAWTPNGANDELVMQTVGFEMEYSISDSEGISIYLGNSQATAY